VPAREQRGWGDDIAGVGVVGAADADKTDQVQRMGVRCNQRVAVSIQQASSIQRSQAGGFVGEAKEVGHGWVICWRVVSARRVGQ